MLFFFHVNISIWYKLSVLLFPFQLELPRLLSQIFKNLIFLFSVRLPVWYKLGLRREKMHW